jgi:hypothetical protein
MSMAWGQGWYTIFVSVFYLGTRGQVLDVDISKASCWGRTVDGAIPKKISIGVSGSHSDFRFQISD